MNYSTGGDTFLIVLTVPHHEALSYGLRMVVYEFRSEQWDFHARARLATKHINNQYFQISSFINTLEEIEIVKASSSKYLLNDVIAGENNPMYKLIHSSVI